jgi:hypothetical protein
MGLRRSVAAVVALGALAAGLTACRLVDGPGPATERVPADFHASEHGVRISIRVGFEEDRTVESAELHGEGGSQDVALWPVGWEQERPPEAVELEAGDEVILEASIVGACPGAGRLPKFEVVSTVDGEEVVDHFAPALAADYRRAYATWCDRPVTVTVGGSRIRPGGAVEMYLEISNPGPDAVAVTVGALRTDSTSWRATSTVVEPGARHPFTVRGRARVGCSATPPWASRNLRVDGHPLTPEHDGWC